jgi:pimeloyl-ACP methyl ester carboxylesterase
LAADVTRAPVLPPLGMPTLGGKQLWGDVFLYGGYRIQRHVRTRVHRLLSPGDVRLAGGTFERCHEVFVRLREQRGVEPTSDHLVLLLHGIFRSKDCFGPLSRALRAAGYDAHGVNYPSTRQGLEDHADQVEELLDRAEGVAMVSFVTHSMGGIVARVLLARDDAAWRKRMAVHRLVFIGTPNRGAEIVTRLQDLTPLRAVAGPSFLSLTPESAADIPMPTVPFGIIAGGTGRERGMNPLLGGDNDMTVRVDETRLEGAEDFLVVPSTHTFLMTHPEVIRATVEFLESGSFAA